jgi:hypothetical protein
MKLATYAALALAGAALARPASAHHSFNMFALDKTTTVTGTVTDFKFKMPHVWLYMKLPTGAAGVLEDWGFEAHSPNLVARKGWNINTLKAGDKISVLMHPMKDGSRAGSVVYVTLPDGKQLWNAEAIDKP